MVAKVHEGRQDAVGRDIPAKTAQVLVDRAGAAPTFLFPVFRDGGHFLLPHRLQPHARCHIERMQLPWRFALEAAFNARPAGTLSIHLITVWRDEHPWARTGSPVGRYSFEILAPLGAPCTQTAPSPFIEHAEMPPLSLQPLAIPTDDSAVAIAQPAAKILQGALPLPLLHDAAMAALGYPLPMREAIPVPLTTENFDLPMAEQLNALLDTYIMQLERAEGMSVWSFAERVLSERAKSLSIDATLAIDACSLEAASSQVLLISRDAACSEELQ